MAALVKLADVVDELEMASDESSAHLNKRTGELYRLTDEELSAAEEDEEGDEGVGGDLADYPEWQREAILKAREILGSDDWLELPNKFDIHEYNIMEEFCRDVDDVEMSERLLRNIRGSGAFGRFKASIHVLGIEQDWYQFRAAAFQNIASEWLEENGIEYIREQTKERGASSQYQQ